MNAMNKNHSNNEDLQEVLNIIQNNSKPMTLQDFRALLPTGKHMAELRAKLNAANPSKPVGNPKPFTAEEIACIRASWNRC